MPGVDILRHHDGTIDETTIPLEDLADRFLFVQALDTRKCFDEGIITSDADANIASIMAIGFPPWTGGTRQFVAGYAGGVPQFVVRTERSPRRTALASRKQPSPELWAVFESADEDCATAKWFTTAMAVAATREAVHIDAVQIHGDRDGSDRATADSRVRRSWHSLPQ